MHGVLSATEDGLVEVADDVCEREFGSRVPFAILVAWSDCSLQVVSEPLNARSWVAIRFCCASENSVDIVCIFFRCQAWSKMMFSDYNRTRDENQDWIAQDRTHWRVAVVPLCRSV